MAMAAGWTLKAFLSSVYPSFHSRTVSQCRSHSLGGPINCLASAGGLLPPHRNLVYIPHTEEEKETLSAVANKKFLLPAPLPNPLCMARQPCTMSRCKWLKSLRITDFLKEIQFRLHQIALSGEIRQGICIVFEPTTNRENEFSLLCYDMKRPSNRSSAGSTK